MLNIKEFAAFATSAQNKTLITERDELSVKIAVYASELRDMIGKKTIIELEISNRGIKENKRGQE